MQPTLHDVIDKKRKYASNSTEAIDLNDAVAKFICKDQVPVYTVEKSGFKN